ncbi:MAG TPA: thiamine phosphate synthase, partial [Planctomycetota bacterium]|nr:thiamine phosphate synthase [Planctomycetota bacterium]
HLPPLGAAAGRIAAAQICLLATARLATRPLDEVVAEAVDAGVDCVQLREKGPSDREILRSARALRDITARRGVLFIVNDRPDIAIRAAADGVHLGQEDLPVAEVRALLEKKMLVGVSTHSVDQALAAEREGADYIGVGPMFPTLTKEAGPLLGPPGLRAVLAAVRLPAFAIGGINGSTVHSIREAGGTRVAISSAILAATDIAAEVAALRTALT